MAVIEDAVVGVSRQFKNVAVVKESKEKQGGRWGGESVKVGVSSAKK